MILIYSDAHEPAPYLDSPLTETNAGRELRPIYKKMRKVRGKTGWILRRYGWILGAPKDDPEGVAHHALQIGPYVYEMTREKRLIGQRLAGEQIWPSTIKHVLIGFTDMSDEDIQIQALKSEAYSRSLNGGKYHIKHNNCQTFINEMERRLQLHALTIRYSDESLLDKVPVPFHAKPATRDMSSTMVPRPSCEPEKVRLQVTAPEPDASKERKASVTITSTIAERRAEKAAPQGFAKGPLSIVTTVRSTTVQATAA